LSNDQAPTEGPDDTADAHVPEGSDYVSDRTFAEFPISDEVIKGITDLGYVTATPVQSATIDPALAGRDLLVRAKTGTGKTCAFSTPVIERLEAGKGSPQAVILAPTRELAQQIAEECEGIAKYKDISIAVLVGGLAIGPQEKVLADGADLIVGTPGRILDHMRRRNLDLSGATAICLDEADEMLSMGFYQDVTSILEATSDERQILLFSATISPDTQRLVDRYLKDPEQIRLSTDGDNVDSIEHILYETSADLHKVRALLFLLDKEDPTSAIIFCNTREDTATVASFLDRQGLDVQLLSGELSQARRSEVMKKVKGGDVRFLVSTDVASRGIDISDLSHVINYSLPFEAAVYLHRTGRTGRIGKKGTAISLVGGPDLATRRALESQHDIQFDERQLPTAEEAVRYRVDRQAKQIKKAMGQLVFESYLPTVRALKERPDGEALLAAALRAFFQWDRQRKIDAGKLDSVGELIQERNAKIERKNERRSGGRDRDRKRGRRRDDDDDRGGRGKKRERRSDRDDRGDRGRRSERSSDATDLDALLVAAEPKKKSRKKSSSKKRRDEAPAEETAKRSSRDDKPKKKSSGKKKGGLSAVEALKRAKQSRRGGSSSKKKGDDLDDFLSAD
jgi:ATP-dependent RNA helicase DeaD